MQAINRLLRDIEFLPSCRVTHVDGNEKQRTYGIQPAKIIIEEVKQITIDKAYGKSSNRVPFYQNALNIFKAKAKEHINNRVILEALNARGIYLGMLNTEPAIDMIIEFGDLYLFKNIDYELSYNKEFALKLIRLQPSTCVFMDVIDDEIFKTTMCVAAIHKAEGGRFFNYCDNMDVEIEWYDDFYDVYYTAQSLTFTPELVEYAIMMNGRFILRFTNYATRENILLAAETFPEVVDHLKVPPSEEFIAELLRRNRRTAAYMDVGLATLNYKGYSEISVFNISFKFI